MNRLKYIAYSFILLITTPIMSMASTTGGGALASEINAVSIMQQIADLLSGELIIAAAIISGMIAGYGFFKKNKGHGSRWEGLYRTGIALIIVTSIAGVVQLLFSGATL